MLNDLEKYMKLYRYYGMLANIGDINTNKDLLNAANTFLKWEISERNERKLNSAIKNTRLKKYGGFDLLQDFDWNWPKKIDKESILELCNLKFIKEHTNIVLIGSSIKEFNSIKA
jgi:IstB-like ATP binding protein